jgi:hypothetical protein
VQVELKRGKNEGRIKERKKIDKRGLSISDPHHRSRNTVSVHRSLGRSSVGFRSVRSHSPKCPGPSPDRPRKSRSVRETLWTGTARTVLIPMHGSRVGFLLEIWSRFPARIYILAADFSRHRQMQNNGSKTESIKLRPLCGSCYTLLRMITNTKEKLDSTRKRGWISTDFGCKTVQDLPVMSREKRRKRYRRGKRKKGDHRHLRISQPPAGRAYSLVK